MIIKYYFDCLNDLGNDNYFDKDYFKNDNEAIKLAQNYEATLYKIITNKNKQQTWTLLYEPWSMFD